MSFPSNSSIPGSFPGARAILLVLAGLVMGAGFASGAIYIRIPNLPGDVKATGYDDGSWFEAFSGTYGVERDLIESSTDGSASLNIGVGRFLPIGMACHLNKAAAPLAQAAASGDLLGDVEIHLVDTDGPEPVTFGIINLQRAFVKDFTMETPSSERPWFQAFFVYSHIEIINRLPDPAGVTEQIVSWNLVTDSEAPLVKGDAVQAWLDGFFTAEQQADPAVGGLFTDFDKDGLPTLLEYKLGTDPLQFADGAGAIKHWMAHVGGEQYLQISFVQRTDASTPEISLDVKVGENLSEWETGPQVVTLLSSTPLGGDLEEVVYRLVRPRSEKPKQFVRLSATYLGGAP